MQVWFWNWLSREYLEAAWLTSQTLCSLQKRNFIRAKHGRGLRVRGASPGSQVVSHWVCKGDQHGPHWDAIVCLPVILKSLVKADWLWSVSDSMSYFVEYSLPLNYCWCQRRALDVWSTKAFSWQLFPWGHVLCISFRDDAVRFLSAGQMWETSTGCHRAVLGLHRPAEHQYFR